jgi:lipopolysaccharide/colanic/teichoic acid biosynthesis glycosyltransferase
LIVDVVGFVGVIVLFQLLLLVAVGRSRKKTRPHYFYQVILPLPRRDSPVVKKRKIIIDSDGKDKEDDINDNEKAIANVEAVQSAQMLHNQYQL